MLFSLLFLCTVNLIFTALSSFNILKLFNNAQESPDPDHRPSISMEPEFIVIAGLPRTGSTMLYNIIRLWVTLVDSNAIVGYTVEHNLIQYAHSQEFSVVTKEHHGKDYPITPDIAFFS